MAPIKSEYGKGEYFATSERERERERERFLNNKKITCSRLLSLINNDYRSKLLFSFCKHIIYCITAQRL